jgi:TonB family protein
MAYSPVAPPPSGALGPHSFMPVSSAVRDEPVPAKPEAGAIFSALRDAIAGGTSDLDVVLGAIAEAAQALTVASGTALAMQREGQVVCLGRSGETAPELGARLSIDSGISGECLRTGRTLRCDDTQKDDRADREVCRKMGLRSIAAVPLRGRHGVVGVLEAFSTRPGAFSEEHMNYLARLAELAETAHARERAAQVSVAIETPETHSGLESVSNVLLQSGRKIAAHLGEGKRRYWTVAATLVLLLVSFAAWKAMSKPTSEASAAGQPIQPHDPALTPASAVGAELAWKPSPERPLNSNRSVAMPSEQPSAKVEVSKAPSDTESSPVSSTKIEHLTAADTIKRAAITDSDSVAVEAPQLSASNLDNRKIGTLLSGPVTLPRFGTPISQGVSEGVLEHQVAPIYPRPAVPLRLEGPVILDATVSENGQLENIKVASGHAMLAQAAIDAVRQWHYRPYLLNGKPVRMQTRITVNFKMPRN